MEKSTYPERSKYDYDLGRGEGGELLIKMLGTSGKFEVKTDFITAESGNMFIEFEDNDGVPTCLSVTDAIWWCHIVTDGTDKPMNVYWFRVEQLRYWLPKLHAQKRIRTGKGGDTGKCTGYLLPACMTQIIYLPKE